VNFHGRYNYRNGLLVTLLGLWLIFKPDWIGLDCAVFNVPANTV